MGQVGSKLLGGIMGNQWQQANTGGYGSAYSGPVAPGSGAYALGPSSGTGAYSLNPWA
jgi:hypothetical protein